MQQLVSRIKLTKLGDFGTAISKIKFEYEKKSVSYDPFFLRINEKISVTD